MGLERPALPAGPAKPSLGRMSCHQGALFTCHPPGLLLSWLSYLQSCIPFSGRHPHSCMCALGRAVCSPILPPPHTTHALHIWGPCLCTSHIGCVHRDFPSLYAQSDTGTHLRLRHVTQRIPHIDEHTVSPFYQGHMRGDSPANPWDLLSQNNGKPQADSCGLRGPTPCVGPALPPSSSTPQPSPSILLPPVHILTQDS